MGTNCLKSSPPQTAECGSSSAAAAIGWEKALLRSMKASRTELLQVTSSESP